MKMHITIFVLILVSFWQSAISQLHEEYYTVLHGYQLDTFRASLVTQPSISIRHCAVHCLAHEVCKAAHYFNFASMCEFSTVDINSTVVGIVTNNISTVILRTGREVYAKTWKDHGAPDCFTGKTNDYDGIVDYTVSGKTCQNWSSDSPHIRTATPINPVDLNTNYCRANESGGPIWCYTNDPQTRFEICDIVPCYACGVTASLPPTPPNAEMNITFRRQSVHVIFRCASLTPGTSENHCPVSTCKINDQWSSDYNMSCTTEDCYTNSATYRGKLSCTVSGRTCQHWNTDTPHIKYYQVSDPNDKSTNYCRDPSNDGYLWCYTIDKDVRWEPCPVPKC